MGRIAAARADRIVVTNDNPRREDPAAIAAAVVAGVRAAGGRNFVVELDRGTAIRAAVARARSGDVVLVAGKGHEDYQERNGVRTRSRMPGLRRCVGAERRRMMDIATAARAVDGRMLGENVPFNRVTTDTRTLGRRRSLRRAKRRALRRP
jgi:hypothetical protein